MRPRSGLWIAPPAKPAKLGADGRFTALGIESRGPAEGCWSDKGYPRLWLYNLHYFDDLAAAPGDPTPSRLLDAWWRDNPPCSRPGWEPYPLSLRIVNICKRVLARGDLSPGWEDRLLRQAAVLDRNLEYDLLANHLLANAKALLFAGAILQGREADRLLERGACILEREVREQVLVDGAHFELSPMYHAIVLEDLLDCLNLLNASGELPARSIPLLRARLEAAIPRMRHWLEALCPDRTKLPRFNDCADGVSLTVDELARYASGVQRGENSAPSDPRHSSGYLRLSQQPFDVIFDAANVGPDYNPGHAHADTLSMEIYAHGERLVGSAGTSTYDPGAQRDYERSTAAHSTVEVDGLNSSEVWHSFRVGRRARVVGLKLDSSSSVGRASASHTGYAHLVGKPVHTRNIEVSEHGVKWRDTVAGSGVHSAVGYIHIEPGIALRMIAPDAAELIGAKGSYVLAARNGVRLEAGKSPVSISFGKIAARPCIVWKVTAALPLSVEVTLASSN